MQDVATCLSINKKNKDTITVYRNRNATRWSESKKPTNGSYDVAGLAEFNAADMEVQRDGVDAETIAELLRRAGDPDPWHEDRAKAFVDCSVAALEKCFPDNTAAQTGHPPSTASPFLVHPAVDPIVLAASLRSDSAEKEPPKVKANKKKRGKYSGNPLVHLLGSEVSEVDVSAHPDLYPAQNRAFVSTLNWLQKRLRYDTDPNHNACPIPTPIIIHGGPGYGKSVFAKTLFQRAPPGTVVCTAPTGIAAAAFENGRTLNSLLDIKVEKKDQKRDQPQPPMTRVIECRRWLEQCRVLIVDETR
jgi:hypothetical protein